MLEKRCVYINYFFICNVYQGGIKMKYCPNCGNELKDGWKFCPECNYSLSVKEEENVKDIAIDDKEEIIEVKKEVEETPNKGNGMTAKKWIALIGIACITFFALAITNGPTVKKELPPQKQEKVMSNGLTYSESESAKRITYKYLKSVMKNTDSMDIKTMDVAYSKAMNVIEVAGVVKGENSFGGQVTHNYVLRMSKSPMKVTHFQVGNQVFNVE